MTKSTQKKPWRQKISMVNYIVMIGVFCVLVAVSVISYMSFQLLVESKYNDTWAISYVELENQTRNIKENIEQFQKQIGFQITHQGEVEYTVKPKYKIEVIGGKIKSTFFPSHATLKDFGIHLHKTADHLFVIELNGEPLLLKKSSYNSKDRYDILLWPFVVNQHINTAQFKKNDSLVYLTNMNGAVVFTNSLKVNSKNVMQRYLVKRFIESSLEKSQVHFSDGKDTFNGFYASIPNSNLVLFSETPDRVILEKIYAIGKNFFQLSVAIVLFAVLLLLLTLRGVTKPINELLINLPKIAQGRFNEFKIESKSFGELNILIQSVKQMVEGLIHRDISIRSLQVKEREKIRLEKDLKIASEIQTNLLPKKNTKKDSLLDFYYVYHAATEVAGDWVGHHFVEETGETVIAIADVSGHGAGSSMFTAITAAIFHESKSNKMRFDALDFMERLHHTVKDLGQNKWHITMQVYVYSNITKKLKVFNAGHVFPFVYDLATKKVSSVVMSSTPICIGDEINIFKKELQIKNDSIFMLYTDGLTEAVNKDKKPFKPVKIRKIIEGIATTNPQRLVDHVLGEWKDFTHGVEQADDLCLVAFKIPGGV